MTLLPTGKPHTSFSEVKNWAECSWRHRLQHVDKIDLSKPSVNLAYGTAAHAVAENFLNTKTIDLTKAREVLDAEWEKYKDSEDFQKTDKEKLMTSIGNIMLCLPKFLDDTFPQWQPIAAEEPLYEDLQKFFDKHSGVFFKGFIDCVLAVPGKKPGDVLYWILDFKTAARPWNRDRLKDDKTRMQLQLYKKFWSEKHNVPMKDIRCGFVIMLKSGKLDKLCYLVPVSVGDLTANRALTVLNNSVASVKRGVAIKNRNSCRYCDYYQTEHCK